MNTLTQVQFEAMKAAYPLHPAPTPSFFSLETVKLIALSILTLGIYGGAKYDEVILDFNVNKMYNNDYEDIICDQMRSWQNLEQDLIVLQERLASGQIGETNEIDRLRERCSQLNDQSLHHGFGSRHSFLDVCFFVLASFFTLGFYPAYQVSRLKAEISLLKEKSTVLTRLFQEKLKDEKGAEMNRAIDLTALQIDRVAKFRLIDGKDTQTYLREIREKENSLRTVVQNQNQVRASNGVMEVVRDEIGAENRNIRNQIAAAQQMGHNLQLEKDGLQANLTILEQRIEQLRSEIQAIETNIQTDDALRASRPQLEAELATLERRKLKMERIQVMQQGIGPKAPTYQRRDEDGNLPGVPGINDEDDKNRGVEPTEQEQAYADRLNGQLTAAGIVRVTFESVYEEFKAKKSVFGLSLKSNIFKQQYKDYLTAVYSLLAIRLIERGSLTQAENRNDCGGPYLILNNNDVKLHPSKPTSVQSYEDGEPVIKNFLPTRDDFTPRGVASESFEEGIDPVSIKWIWNRLSSEEKEQVIEALTDPAAFDESSADHLPAVAHKLILTMGKAIEINFHPVLLNDWNKLKG